MLNFKQSRKAIFKKNTKIAFTFILIFTLILSNVFGIIAPNKAFAYSIPAKAGLVMDAASGKVLFGQNQDVKLFPASTTKIMTALVVLENAKLEDEITVPSDYENAGESSLGIKANEKYSVKDLLYATMLKSANDAAEVLAIGVAGSIDKFANLMNEKVEALGLKNTHFANPSGLHNENHYTTAYDLGIIAVEACKNETFNEIIKTKTYKMANGTVLYSHNDLLDIYDFADGIKTGYTKQAGRCLVSSATKEGDRLIGVILDGEDVFEKSKEMLDFTFNNFRTASLMEKGEVKTKAKVNKGVENYVNAIAKDDMKVWLDRVTGEINTKGKVHINPELTAPIKAGDVIGYYSYKDSDDFTYKVDLYAENDVEKRPGLFEIFSTIWHNFWSAVLI